MKPLLEIRCANPLTAHQVEMVSNHLEGLRIDYEVLILDAGMSAHIHDDAILEELRQIKSCLRQIKNNQ